MTKKILLWNGAIFFSLYILYIILLFIHSRNVEYHTNPDGSMKSAPEVEIILNSEKKEQEANKE